MTDQPTAADDRWTEGDAYEAYMGRWSRTLAPAFLEWLAQAPGGHWLDVGCGTGALAGAILAHAEPVSVAACDPSTDFVEHVRARFAGRCAGHVIAAPNALPSRAGGFDAVVSGLVLNFVPDPKSLLEVMQQRTRRGGTVAVYVWDYRGGVDLLRYFWEEAVLLNPAAAVADESQRFGRFDGSVVVSAFRAAGLARIETTVLDIQTVFRDFDDYWEPFLLRSGPAPSYVASLDPTERELLRSRLEQRLGSEHGSELRLRARALAARGASS